MSEKSWNKKEIDSQVDERGEKVIHAEDEHIAII